MFDEGCKGLDYHPFYCEENVWRLLSRPDLSRASAWAVIVSSAARHVVVMRQKAGRPLDGLIHWDYHVFALTLDAIRGLVALDMDSDVGFPAPFERYVAGSYPATVQAALEPRFRVMRAADYVAGLVSDRSHMRRADGSWLAPPPPWAYPGRGTGKPNVLMEWIDMSRRTPGTVYDAAGLASFAAGILRRAR